MKNRFILVIICSLTAYNLQAQDTIRSPPKWELGVDLYSIFKPAEPHLYQSTYGLIVKRTIKNDMALRFRTNFGFQFMPKPDVKGANQPRSLNLSFDLGIEKKKTYGKFIHYYGLDGVVKYIRFDDTIGFGVSGANATYTQQRGYVKGIGVSAFTGGKYHITSHIAIAIETNLTLFYAKRYSTDQNVDLNNKPITELNVNGKSNDVSLDILPISAIYLSYYF